jgi:hypothetical protein
MQDTKIPPKPVTPLAVLIITGLLGCTMAGCPPAEPPPPRHPTALPPQRPTSAPQCKGGLYLRGGRWIWADGAWKWQKPRCAPKPAHWHDGCVWEQGQWRRSESGLRFTPGRLVCRPRQGARDVRGGPQDADARPPPPVRPVRPAPTP